MTQKFKVGYTIKYNGNIYRVVGVENGKQNYRYNVECLKNNFPDEPVSSSIGSCAEDKMELVEFNEPTEKQQLIEKAIRFFESYITDNSGGYEREKIIEDFKKYIQ